MSIETDLKKEQVIHLDLGEFSQVQSGTPVRAVIDQMRREHHNCALVIKDGSLTGVFTDRDILQKIAAEPETWDRPVDEFMTASPTIVKPDDLVDHALKLMIQGHFRNVPVVDEQGVIQGNVSHYAFIKFLADHFPKEIYNLSPDDGIHEDRYGG